MKWLKGIKEWIKCFFLLCNDEVDVRYLGFYTGKQCKHCKRILSVNLTRK